ncbi:MAG: alpha/beta hydrolase [Ignavibacteria bacterium]|jgi:pimeloyl-ACP methyl ester carboxylesterase|nr:alpha/beta hydrolase [Ignavibacteria bacterium]
MLSRIQDDNITSRSADYTISGSVKLHTEILCTQGTGKRRALFLHGGGVTGNHTIVRRPSMWLLSKGVFDEIIMPDRRGCGGSSSYTGLTSTGELACDMKILLDEMKISEPLTVIASSYGGPIALILASIGKRIEKVILLGSSPMLTLTKGILEMPYSLGLIVPTIKLIIRLFTGRAGTKGYPDLDFVYDITSISGYIGAQIDILKKIKRSRISSMFLQAESVFHKENMSLPLDIKIEVPVIQVIGERDSVWERNIPAKYLKNMPFFHQVIIKDASHKDIFLKADEFLKGALEALSAEE